MREMSQTNSSWQASLDKIEKKNNEINQMMVAQTTKKHDGKNLKRKLTLSNFDEILN